jgi:hypothetical protein
LAEGVWEITVGYHFTHKERPMKNLMFPNVVLIAAVIVAIAAIGGCGSKMEGTYTNTGGMVTLDLKSGGKATFTMMGESLPCIYKVKDNKVMLDCTPKGEKVDFMIHDDGSLTGPSFIGSMKKSA